MEIKGDNIYVNIKELPVVDQIVPGDYLIVETENGTNILDFNNFIVQPGNTTFYGNITQNTSNIAILSSNLNTLNSSTFTTISSVSASLYTTIQSTSSTLYTTITSVSSDLYTITEAATANLYCTLQSFSASALTQAVGRVSFNPAGSIVGKAGNINSVVKSLEGIYTVNFQTPLPVNTYTVVATCTGEKVNIFTGPKTTASCVLCSYSTNSNDMNSAAIDAVFFY